MKGFFQSGKGVGIILDGVVLAGGSRTPFGKFCGSLGTVSPIDLGVFASRGALQAAGYSPGDIHQCIISNIGQACGDAYFLPRHIALFSGIPQWVPALMVQRICASGLETVVTGSEQILLGKADRVLCCGTENMSLAPTVSFGNRMGYALGRPDFRDMLWEALDDTAAGFPMGGTAENLAKKYGIPREEVDQFAFFSQKKMAEAQKNGVFSGEISPVKNTVWEIEGLKSRKVRVNNKAGELAVDENPRETTLEALGTLPTVFDKAGVQTAGNSSGIVDGSAAVIITSAKQAEMDGKRPLARIVAAASSGVDPKIMGIGPVPAIQLLLEMTGLKLEDIGLVEINEAFGAQVIACQKELGLDPARLNVNGGAIAIGHPLGATGTRLILTLAHEMRRRNVKYGIASACIGGGQGTAVLLENLF